MKSQILVCPFCEELFARLRQHELIVRTEHAEEIADIYAAVSRSANRLRAIVLDAAQPFTELALQELPKELPVLVFAREFGEFRAFLKMLALLRTRKLTLFLSSDRAENLLRLRMLSSLGIRCGVSFGNKPVDWENVTDLMCYAVYSHTRHAPIEPFAYAVSHTPRNGDGAHVSKVYLNHPAGYLHLAPGGQIALSREELLNQEFIGDDVDSLEELERHAGYQQRLEAWKSHFLEEEGCAYCPGWRMCMGTFAHTASCDTGCRRFFTELIEAAEFHREHIAPKFAAQRSLFDNLAVSR